MRPDIAQLLELTPQEQEAARIDAVILAAARLANGPGAPSIKELFPSAIADSDLEAAAAGGKLHRVKLAIRSGEEVNQACVLFATPLHAAAINGHLEVVQLLVACGANVAARDEQGKMAADVAATGEIARFLSPAAPVEEPR